MEFFNKAKAVRLRSHLEKYLVADEDERTVRQTRNGSSRKVNWTIEFVEENSHMVRLKSCYGKYLTASETPLLLGMNGKKVIQTEPNIELDSSIEWEPIRDGFQVKLRTKEGKFLRANGWKNLITHDGLSKSGSQDWVLWDVEMVDESEVDSLVEFEKQLSRFSSISEDQIDSPTSPWSMESTKSPRLSSSQLVMELFDNAKTIRLRSHHNKYLLAEEDEESVYQDRTGSSKTARWTVEFVHGGTIIRLKSCFGKYLTASNVPFLRGMSQRKVLQTSPGKLDSSVEWEPIREGTQSQVKFKTRYGNFLRANAGLPPWRNSVTHDIPHRSSTQDWILWNIEPLEIGVQESDESESIPESPSDASSLPSDEPSSPSAISIKPTTLSSRLSSKLSKLQSRDTSVNSSQRVDGRMIYYSIADENGEVLVEDGVEGTSFTFKGNGVDELTRKLEEETGLEDIIVCTRSPLNGKLYPLRLQLPPNNGTMHLVVVQASSKVAKDFAQPGLL